MRNKPEIVITIHQISAKGGTDSRFVVEANPKSLYPKLSWGSILKSQNRVQLKHEYQPGSNSLENITQVK